MLTVYSTKPEMLAQHVASRRLPDFARDTFWNSPPHHALVSLARDSLYPQLLHVTVDLTNLVVELANDVLTALAKGDDAPSFESLCDKLLPPAEQCIKICTDSDRYETRSGDCYSSMLRMSRAIVEDVFEQSYEWVLDRVDLRTLTALRSLTTEAELETTHVLVRDGMSLADACNAARVLNKDVSNTGHQPAQ